MSAESALWTRFLREKRNALRGMRQQPALKLVVLTTAAVAFEVGLFALFLGGLRFMSSLGAGGTFLLHRLFSVFFLGMTLLLTLSALVSAYATLFRAGDTPLLLVSPTPPQRIVLMKCIEAAELSAGAYVFIVLPFVAAYAVYGDGAAWIVLWTTLFSLPLLALTTSAGLLAALVTARWFPLERRWRRLLIGGLLLVLGGVLARSGWQAAADPATAQVTLSNLVPGLRVASHAATPGFWMAEGMFALERGQWVRGAMLWLTMASSACVGLLLIEWVAERTYQEAWLRVAGGAARRRSVRMAVGLDRLLGVLPADVRALVLKDVRVFLRDPMQWSQSLIFFGLLTLYYASLRGFRYDQMGEGWRNFSAFMNVFSVAAVTCSLGARFVYPQLSFEGQAYWLLGLAPTRPRRVVLTKFAMSAVCLLTMAVFLMQLSARMLNAPDASRTAVTWLSIATALAVSGLATGLGAVFIDLRHRNPAAVVSGFGGTLNLVLGLGFIIGSLAPFGSVFHAHALTRIGDADLSRILPWLYLWLGALTLLATVPPLWFGCRSLARRDF